MDLRYETILAERETEATRKGERTRAALMRAAVQILNERGFRDMRVTDICELAGVSKATFWVYFPDKTSITVEILQNFIDEVLNNIGSKKPSTSMRERIYNANLLWVLNVKLNPGIMKCIFNLSEEVEEFKSLYLSADEALFRKFIHRMKKDYEHKIVNEVEFEMIIHVLYGAMDAFTSKIVSQPDSRLRELVDTAGYDDEKIAAFLSDIWYKVLDL